MMSLKKIRQLTNPKYVGPTVIVPKPNGSMRITHDYSGLKERTPLFKFKQDKIEDIWSWAAKKQYMIKLDFIKAFHAVPISTEEQPVYSFIGPDRNYYCYCVLPMGTRNSPALFAEFMAKSLENFQQDHREEIRIYQDDIAICCATPSSTIDLATNIIEAMKLSGLYTNVEKSYMDPIEPKPLLGALWKPNQIIQQENNLQLLQQLWQE
eukprot:GHVP01027230.1.p1 GENE.GHVP01027230.1~~GHVP01027230.1.p1  ORF type:complete len:209 (+),score=14.39 GHVP01027230.1:61-687(+)